jgi:HJR/Mrr/RecB family endonuclease
MTNLTFPVLTPIVPLPEELSGVNFGIRPKKMSGSQFVALFQWAAPQLGFKVTPMKKTRDWGCDLRLEKDGIKIVVQLKQQQKNIGVDAVYAVHAAQDHFNADKAMIVITSEFTQPALELAKEFVIECWDWQRLCTEFRNHNIYYPME